MEVFFAYETYQKHYWPYLVIYVYDLIGWEVEFNQILQFANYEVDRELSLHGISSALGT